MTAHRVTPDRLADVDDGQEIELAGEVIHVGPPTVNLTAPANGRTGRTVTLFVETDEDPRQNPLVDAAGNPQDDRTFAELTDGADDYRPNRADPSATPAAQRPDVTLEEG